MPIEGRDDEVIILTFSKPWASYNEHDVAAFLPEHAQELIELGVAVEGGGVDDPPVNLAAPYVTQDGALINCTMGEWAGSPSSYAYAWTSDGVAVGDGTTPYLFTVGDVGKTIICLVTATNPAGSTEAPPSNELVVVEPPAGTELAHSRRRRS
jgi:hypothetical protein